MVKRVDHSQGDGRATFGKRGTGGEHAEDAALGVGVREGGGYGDALVAAPEHVAARALVG